MRENLDTLRPFAVVLGWVLALLSSLLAVVTAALGQGLGAWTGGCRWIGVSLPIHRQLWALVNQPLDGFSAAPVATGYWLGSILLPLLVALTAVILFPRGSTFHVELLAVHGAWAMAVVALAWMPLIDPADGHLARWLHFRHAPAEAVWAAPAIACGVAVLAALRLLALTRIARPHAGRAARAAVLILHLGVPSALWVVCATVLAGGWQLRPSVAAGLPLAVVVTVAWFRYPPLPVYAPREADGHDLLRTALIAAVLAGIVWGAGRPLPEGRCAGLLWSRPSATNNIRVWIDARRVLDAGGGGAQPALPR